MNSTRGLWTACLFYVASSVLATPPPKACQGSTVDAWGQSEAAKARAFLTELKTLVRAGDRAKLSAVVAYPLNVYATGSKRVIHNRAEFLHSYSALITDRVGKAVLEQSSECLFGRDVGAMVGNGELWFAEQQGGSYRIISINLNAE